MKTKAFWQNREDTAIGGKGQCLNVSYEALGGGATNVLFHRVQAAALYLVLEEALGLDTSVKIEADNNSVTVEIIRGKVSETMEFAEPGMLSGADLERVLIACGTDVDYNWNG